jgi:hypothetical protein
MNRRLIHALILFLLGSSLGAQAADLSPAQSARIEYLIGKIESLPNAQFIRNGTSYDAKSAAGHLRLKLRNAGSRVKSAEDFIRDCASQSSMSGMPYLVRFSDGRVISSGAGGIRQAGGGGSLTEPSIYDGRPRPLAFRARSTASKNAWTLRGLSSQVSGAASVRSPGGPPRSPGGRPRESAGFCRCVCCESPFRGMRLTFRKFQIRSNRSIQIQSLDTWPWCARKHICGLHGCPVCAASCPIVTH